MMMRRRHPILFILLFAAAACNRGATGGDSSSRQATAVSQTAPDDPKAVVPSEPARAMSSTAVAVPNDPPRSVVMVGAAPAAASGDLASTIVDAALFPDPRVREVYEKARLVTDRLDRMYCYCHCHEEMGHRSLLSCFQGNHAAECGICLREGYQAWADWQAGRSVEESQQAADAVYHQGAPPPSRPAAE